MSPDDSDHAYDPAARLLERIAVGLALVAAAFLVAVVLRGGSTLQIVTAVSNVVTFSCLVLVFRRQSRQQ